MKPRVYVETSVVSYLTGRLSRDARVLANQLNTRDWWRVAREKFDLVASPLVADGTGLAESGPVRDWLSVLASLPSVGPSDASEVLGQQFIDSHALPASAVLEATHIAIAVTNGVEFLTTWNFLHIANPANVTKINLVCHEAGYQPTVICTPEQLMKVQDDQPRDDPMIAEIREYRDKQAARFGYNAAAIIRHYRALHKASGRPSQYPSRRLDESSAPKQSSGSRSDETTLPGKE